jgi:hypothetical protein
MNTLFAATYLLTVLLQLRYLLYENRFSYRSYFLSGARSKKAGRASAINTEHAPNQVAWLRGNDGWNRKYRVRPLGATRASPFRFHPTMCTSVYRASPTVALSS